MIADRSCAATHRSHQLLALVAPVRRRRKRHCRHKSFQGMLALNKPVIVSEEALVAPVVVPDAAPGLAAKAAVGRAGLCRAGRHQLLAFPQRHHAVADRVGLSDPEGELRAGLRADRHDHAGVPVHRVAAAAAWSGISPTRRRSRSRSRSAWASRSSACCCSASRMHYRDHPDRGGAGRAGLGGVPSGVGADRAAGLGRALRLRAIGVSARRQFRHLDGAGAGGA